MNEINYLYICRLNVFEPRSQTVQRIRDWLNPKPDPRFRFGQIGNRNRTCGSVRGSNRVWCGSEPNFGSTTAAIADPDPSPVGPAIANPDAAPIADIPPDVPPVADPALVANAIAKPIPIAKGTPLADADPIATPAPVTALGPIAAPT
jgi:hypothetical protein